MANVYCTQAQLTLRFDIRTFGELSRDDGSTTPDSDAVDAALDDAADELESYLKGRYSLPLATVSGVLTRWVAIKAVEHLYGRRADMPQAVKDEIVWAEEWIDRLVRGLIGLPTIARDIQPELKSSENLEGRSRFDPGAAHFDRNDTDTSTSKGRGQS